MIQKKLYIVYSQTKTDGFPYQWMVAADDFFGASAEAKLTKPGNADITEIQLASPIFNLKVSSLEAFKS
jgi:hypothetical protein